MSASPPDSDRLANIEILLSHLQHDVDKLNEALIAQQTEIREVRRSLRRVESEVDLMGQLPSDPLDERPPHY